LLKISAFKFEKVCGREFFDLLKISAIKCVKESSSHYCKC
jgi:hypothetical protein